MIKPDVAVTSALIYEECRHGRFLRFIERLFHPNRHRMSFLYLGEDQPAEGGVVIVWSRAGLLTIEEKD